MDIASAIGAVAGLSWLLVIGAIALTVVRASRGRGSQGAVVAWVPLTVFPNLPRRNVNQGIPRHCSKFSNFCGVADIDILRSYAHNCK